MNVSRVWLPLMCAVLAGCAHRTAVDPIASGIIAATTPKPVAKVDVTPTGAAVDEAERARQRAEARAANAEASLSKTRTALSNATANADRAFTEGVAAGSKEATQLRDDLLVLASELEQAEEQLPLLRVELDAVRDEHTRAKFELAKVRDTATDLWTQNETFRQREVIWQKSMAAAEAARDQARADTVKAQQATASAEKSVAALKPYRLVVWTTVGVLVVGGVLWLLIRIKIL